MYYETLIEGGKHWSLSVRAGTQLRITDQNGGANVGMLFYNPQNLLERYNAPDTLKCQHTFRLTQGPLSLLGHGPHFLLHHRRSLGVARHGLRQHEPRDRTSTMGREELPGVAQ